MREQARRSRRRSPRCTSLVGGQADRNLLTRRGHLNHPRIRWLAMSDHDPYGDPTRADTPVTEPTMAMPTTTGTPPPVGPAPTGRPPAEPPDRRPWIIV